MHLIRIIQLRIIKIKSAEYSVYQDQKSSIETVIEKDKSVFCIRQINSVFKKNQQERCDNHFAQTYLLIKFFRLKIYSLILIKFSKYNSSAFILQIKSRKNQLESNQKKRWLLNKSTNTFSIKLIACKERKTDSKERKINKNNKLPQRKNANKE
ncbi:hypothetical protein ABPG72_014518 [Tetrahymena utriculariae]